MHHGKSTAIYKNILLIWLYSHARYYAKIMEKILAHGEDFLHKEKTRLANIAKSEDVTNAKLDDFNIRKNILASFDKDATPVEHE